LVDFDVFWTHWLHAALIRVKFGLREVDLFLSLPFHSRSLLSPFPSFLFDSFASIYLSFPVLSFISLSNVYPFFTSPFSFPSPPFPLFFVFFPTLSLPSRLPSLYLTSIPFPLFSFPLTYPLISSLLLPIYFCEEVGWMWACCQLWSGLVILGVLPCIVTCQPEIPVKHIEHRHY